MRCERSVAILAYTTGPSYWITKLWISSRCGPVELKGKTLKDVYEKNRQNCTCGRNVIRLDSYAFSALINELWYSPAFRTRFVNGPCGREKTTVLCIRLTNPTRFPLDYQWNYKVQMIVNRHLELEKLMWYLSTLGGAFSALGDVTSEYAHRAGQISWEQFKVALVLGDPITVARCKLYMAISYIQTGKLRAAKFIIRRQYRFAISANVADNRQLKNVCLGVWSKLQYAYEIRRLKKKGRNAVCAS